MSSGDHIVLTCTWQEKGAARLSNDVLLATSVSSLFVSGELGREF
jgi:hypothetical protein